LRAALARVPLTELRVIEPACGPAAYLRHFGAGSRGIDRSPEVCKSARKSLAAVGRADIDVVAVDLDQRGWSHELPPPPFEAAFLCDVVMHLTQPAAMLAELATLLVPNAPVLAIEWVQRHGAVRSRLARLVPGAHSVFTTKKHHRHYHSDQLVALYESAGFQLEDSWLHSFEGRPGGALLRLAIGSFWPARTWLLRAPG
jgi:hypothetical protein